MKIISLLTELEHLLDDLSFKELQLSQAKRLKKSVQIFKCQLEKQALDYTQGQIQSKQNSSAFQAQTHETSDEGQNTNLQFSRLSHDLKIPLNRIIQFINLLKEEELSKKQLSKINTIENTTQTLLNITNEQLVKNSRLNVDLEINEKLNFNLRGLVKDVMYLCRTLLNNKDIHIESRIDDKVPEILVGDPAKLTQVLLNILGYAIKYVQEGSIDLAIYLQKKENNNYYLEFIIKDTGIGLATNQLKHIFDASENSENNRVDSSYDLDLSISKQIVLDLNGNINVNSVLGKGSEFQLILPYKKSSIDLKSKINVSKKNESNVLKNYSILVFEDDELERKLLEERLKIWGCKFYFTDNVVYGLMLLESHKIDLVLTDLNTHNYRVFDIAGKIRRNKVLKIREIPIIDVASSLAVKNHQIYSKYKINDQILKPYTAEELLNKIIENTMKMKKTVSIPSKYINPDIEIISDATKINLSKVLEECLGKIFLLEELVLLYKQNTLEFIGVLSSELPDGDMKTVAFAAHKVKFGLGMMQSKSLHSLVVQIESILKADGDKKYINFLLKAFVEEYQLVEKAIDQQLNALKSVN